MTTAKTSTQTPTQKRQASKKMLGGKKPLNDAMWQELVDKVESEGLTVTQELTDVEKGIDEYIAKHQLCYVLDGVGFYYTWYSATGEWLKLSWYKLRRDCPLVFKEDKFYLAGQSIVMRRLKAAGRVFKTCRLKTIEFE